MHNDEIEQWIAGQLANLSEAELLQVKAKLDEINVKGRETVWCEAHGGLANPHFERSDCRYPHFTDEVTRARLNESRRNGLPMLGDRVEVEDATGFPKGTVVHQPADRQPPNEYDTFIWVRYENGSICPIREWRVRRVRSVAQPQVS